MGIENVDVLDVASRLLTEDPTRNAVIVEVVIGLFQTTGLSDGSDDPAVILAQLRAFKARMDDLL